MNEKSPITEFPQRKARKRPRLPLLAPRGNRLRRGSPGALRGAMAAYQRSLEYLDPRDPRRLPTLPKLTFMEKTS
jgi:hypothetical protein